MTREPIELPEHPASLNRKGRSKQPTISPRAKRWVWIASAVIAMVLSGVAQTVALVKGCRAEDVGVSAKADSAVVGQKVERLKTTVSQVSDDVETRDTPQVELLNALVMRVTILEKLCVTDASPRATAVYRARKKEQPELKTIKVPEVVPVPESTPAPNP
jgi:hypothetical protein